MLIVKPNHFKVVQSCGCVSALMSAALRTTHGQSKSRTYKIWTGIIKRTENQKCAQWHLYGGRGIRMCRRWRESFACFLRDMGEAPDGRGIDRYPDKDGNYEPGNCRWATPKENANNTRSNVRLEISGEVKTVTEWRRTTGLHPRKLYAIGKRV